MPHARWFRVGNLDVQSRVRPFLCSSKVHFVTVWGLFERPDEKLKICAINCTVCDQTWSNLWKATASTFRVVRRDRAQGGITCFVWIFPTASSTTPTLILVFFPIALSTSESSTEIIYRIQKAPRWGSEQWACISAKIPKTKMAAIKQVHLARTETLLICNINSINHYQGTPDIVAHDVG